MLTGSCWSSCNSVIGTIHTIRSNITTMVGYISMYPLMTPVHPQVHISAGVGAGQLSDTHELTHAVH